MPYETEQDPAAVRSRIAGHRRGVLERDGAVVVVDPAPSSAVFPRTEAESVIVTQLPSSMK